LPDGCWPDCVISNCHKLDKRWNFPVDNHFASHLATKLGAEFYEQRRPRAHQFCDDCQALNFSALDFSISYEVHQLQSRAAECDLCELFWTTCERNGGTKFPRVRFHREESTLRMNNSGPPALHICKDPSMDPGPESLDIAYRCGIEQRN
jgi:hypothetical protein